MDSDFWHARWQANQIGFHQDEINPYLVRYWPELKLPPASRVLVPLCGKTLDMVWLLDQGHAVTGVEVSRIAVEAFFAENRITADIRRESGFSRWQADRLEIVCGDFFALKPADTDRVDALYDRAALIALPPEQRARYAAAIAEFMAPQTSGLLITLEYNQREMPGPPFAVPDAEVTRLYQDSFSVARLARSDILADQPRFREQGLTALYESVYRLQRR